MFIGDFEIYQSQYEKGIRKISYRSSRPKILKEPIGLRIEKSHGNYDLFFNVNGLLLHSVHSEERQKFKVIYGYNRKKKLISVMKLFSETNELISLSEFIYDNQGRIENETVRAFYDVGWDETRHHIHSYNLNTEIIFITNENDEEEDGTFYYTYNNNNDLIEEKAFNWENELVLWNKCEYDEDNNLIREISLDENGVPFGEYEFFQGKHNVSSGLLYNENDSKFLKEYSLTFNEKGHWINQVVMIDGVPSYFYDRTIEYY